MKILRCVMTPISNWPISCEIVKSPSHILILLNVGINSHLLRLSLGVSLLFAKILLTTSEINDFKKLRSIQVVYKFLQDLQQLLHSGDIHPGNREGLPGGGGSLLQCSLPKLPYVPMFPHIFRMFSYCNFSNFVPLFPKIG